MNVAINKLGQRQRAFTLVELLVVISIIAILVSLLLPAVGVVRDRARSAQNLNNLNGIGKAILIYEEAKKSYPPTVKVSIPQSGDPPQIDDRGRGFRERTYSTTWAFELLPYLEHQNMYNKHARLKKAYDTGLDPETGNNNGVAFGTIVPIYANPRRRDSTDSCPIVEGNNDPSNIRGAGCSLDYAANGGYLLSGIDTNNDGIPELRANDDMYSGNEDMTTSNNPLKFNPKTSGPFSLDWTVRISSALVRDGTSHTIAVGDRHIPLKGIEQPRYDESGLVGSSVYSIIRFMNQNEGSSSPFPFDVSNDPSPYLFGTPRGDQSCFVFLDGHAEWIPFSADPVAMLYRSAIADGEVINDQ